MARNPRPFGTMTLRNRDGSVTRNNAKDWGCTESGRIEKAGDLYAKPKQPVKPIRKDAPLETTRNGRMVGGKRMQLVGQVIASKIAPEDAEQYVRSQYKWDGYRYVAVKRPEWTVTVRTVNGPTPTAEPINVSPSEVKLEVKSRSGSTREISQAELVKRMKAKVARWQARGVPQSVIEQRVRKAIAA